MNCIVEVMNTSIGNWNTSNQSDRLYNDDYDERSVANSDDSLHFGFGPYDVLCGRDREAFNNIGNRRFRVTVSILLDRYVSAKSRQDKSLVILAVIDIVRGNGGRFVRQRDGVLVELDDKQTREKVGHCLRDMATARDLTKSPTSSPQSSAAKASSCGAGGGRACRPAERAPSADRSSGGPEAKFSDLHLSRCREHGDAADPEDFDLFSDLSDQDLEDIQRDSELNRFKDIFE